MTVLNKTRRTSKSLSNWGASAGRVLQLFPSSRFVLPSSASEALEEDAKNLSNDIAKIGRDISSTLSSKEWIAKSNDMRIEMNEDDANQTIQIKVIGVGGGGGNALEHMIASKIKGVQYITANTDAQALARSSAQQIIQLGLSGLGAGSKPERGREAALLADEEIRRAIEGAHMLFITAGMGGGTGTGASPVIARIAREMGILTVAVVTKPFDFEGTRRMSNAEAGLIELEANVDALLVVLNEKLLEVLGEDVSEIEAFAYADDIMKNAVDGVAQIITAAGGVSTDFEDVRTIMSESGRVVMGTAVAQGSERAQVAAEAAISCPLLEDADMSYAKGLLLLLSASEGSLKLAEARAAMKTIRAYAAPDANVIYGSAIDNSLGDKLRVTVIATGLQHKRSLTTVQPQLQVLRNGTDGYSTSTIEAQLPSNMDTPFSSDAHRQIQREAAKNKINTLAVSGMDDLEIPAFLRKQAD